MASSKPSIISATRDSTTRNACHSSWFLPVLGLCGSLVLGGIGAVSDANAAGPNATPPCATGDGSLSTQCGVGADASGDESTAVGQGAGSSGNRSTAVGQNATAQGFRSTSVGEDSKANGFRSTSLGQDADATESNSTAIGQGAQALATGATALGQGAIVDLLHNNSTAIGVGAQTTQANQMVFGTTTSTYTLPGLAPSVPPPAGTAQTSAPGILGVMTIDSAGNLANDGGTLQTQADASTAGVAANATDIGTNSAGIAANAGGIATNAGGITTNASGIASNDADIAALDGRVGTNETDIATLRSDLDSGISGNSRRIDEATEGVAMALALDSPDLFGGQTFAMRLGYGNFEGYDALGFSAAGLLGRNLLGGGETWSVNAGVGFGLDHDTVGAKAGVQVGW